MLFILVAMVQLISRSMHWPVKQSKNLGKKTNACELFDNRFFCKILLIRVRSFLTNEWLQYFVHIRGGVQLLTQRRSWKVGAAFIHNVCSCSGLWGFVLAHVMFGSGCLFLTDTWTSNFHNSQMFGSSCSWWSLLQKDACRNVSRIGTLNLGTIFATVST